MAWTEERIALLTRFWQEGHSASQIAEALGEGLTRNAVIGKAHRLGLASRPSPLKGTEAKADAKDTRGRKRAPAPAAAVAPAPTVAERADTVAAEAPVALAAAPAAQSTSALAAAPPQAPRRAGKPGEKARRVTLLDLNDRICKWPIGHPDEADFHFCGKPVAPGFPYCGEHCLLAYQSQQPRRDRPAGPPPPFRPNLPRVR